MAKEGGGGGGGGGGEGIRALVASTEDEEKNGYVCATVKGLCTTGVSDPVSA